MVENKYRINQITIKSKAKCFCPLGKDWYTNQFEVYMEPSDFIPDYCELDDFIEQQINGKEFIIEEAVAVLYEYIAVKYKPVVLSVESAVDDAAHSAVTVTRNSYDAI